jgi:hypothetical protein
MARSKTKVLEVEQKNYGEFLKVPVELEDGEVVIAGYERHHWFQAPKGLQQKHLKIAVAPPVAVYGKRSARGQ